MMTIRDWIDLRADECDVEILVMDGYDECILGLGYDGGTDPKVVYDRAQVIENLARDMGYDDAWEFHNFNQDYYSCGVLFLDRPGPFDGVLCEEFYQDQFVESPWWWWPARIGVGVGAAVVVVGFFLLLLYGASLLDLT